MNEGLLTYLRELQNLFRGLNWDKIIQNPDYFSFIKESFEENRDHKKVGIYLENCVRKSVYITQKLGWKETLFVKNSNLLLMRNEPWQFFRIFRSEFAGINHNFHNYSKTKQDFDAKEFDNLIEKLKDPKFRFEPKSDFDEDAPVFDVPRTIKTITDAPGFGSGRLTDPFEENSFDKEFSDFCNLIVEDGDTVADYGGGTSPFLALLEKGRKTLIDINEFRKPLEKYDIQYLDSLEWTKNPTKFNVIFCFQTLEHLDNPEEVLKIFCDHSDVCIFTTPHQELFEDSIYHHIYVDPNILKNLFKRYEATAFIRISKIFPLDIHGIIVNSEHKLNLIKNNKFFQENYEH